MALRGSHPSRHRPSRIAIDRRQKIKQACVVSNRHRFILLLNFDPIKAVKRRLRVLPITCSSLMLHSG